MIARTDVAVVGAGPAGAATALLLACAGFHVTLIDRAIFPRPKACAEYFSPGVVACLERLGIWDRIAALPHARLRGMELVAPSGRRHLVAYPDVPGPRRALAVRRDVFDGALATIAQQAGAHVRVGVDVQGLDPPDDGWRLIHMRSRAGSSSLAARLVVVADGVRSRLVTALGLSAPPHWPPRLGLVVHYAGVATPADHGEMYVGRGVYCGLAPLGHGALNVGLVVPLRQARRLGSAEGIVDWTLRRLPAVAARLEGARRTDRPRGIAPLAHRCRRPYADGVLVVGDAAGFLDPFTGEGVYRALRGAELAAAQAKTAIELGDVSARALAPYAVHRHRAFAAKDRLCLLIQAFVAKPALLEYAVRRLPVRPQAATLAAALGDVAPAEDALAPRLLWQLLRP